MFGDLYTIPQTAKKGENRLISNLCKLDIVIISRILKYHWKIVCAHFPSTKYMDSYFIQHSYPSLKFVDYLSEKEVSIKEIQNILEKFYLSRIARELDQFL